jgi:hypothetical protein
MRDEIESLNNQIRNLKKALQTEIRYKSNSSTQSSSARKIETSPSKTVVLENNEFATDSSLQLSKEWDEIERHLITLQDQYNRHVTSVGQEYDSIGEGLEQLASLYRQMEQESAQTKKRCLDLEKENIYLRQLLKMDEEQWKEKTLELMRELDQLKSASSESHEEP